MNELTDRDREILDFEASWWKYPAAKEAEILDRFELSATRYYARLNMLLTEPAAMEYAPMTVRRLLRLKAARAEARSRRRLG